MSIEREYQKYTLGCDTRGETVTCEDFQECVDYKKANGWKLAKYRGEWFDICPECTPEHATKP